MNQKNSASDLNDAVSLPRRDLLIGAMALTTLSGLSALGQARAEEPAQARAEEPGHEHHQHTVDQGRTRDEERDDRWRNFTGAGLSFNVVGPWKTVIAFSYGRALASDVEGLSGKQEFLFTVLKLF